MGKSAPGEEWINAEDFQIPADIPQPQLWRILIAPVRPKSESKGGIALPDSVLDNTDALVFLGKVVGMGPMAGKKDNWPEGAYDIHVGDWVVIGRYAGQRIEFQGTKLVLLNDDEVLAKASGPEGFRVYL